MRWSLTHGLAIEAAAEVGPVVEKWLPLSALPHIADRPDLRWIHVHLLTARNRPEPEINEDEPAAQGMPPD
jgi:hypothetical protein